jgi:hypothetical protein
MSPRSSGPWRDGDRQANKKRGAEGRAQLAEKLKIIFSYGADLLRGKQIMNPDRFFTVCRGFLFVLAKLEFINQFYI